MIQKNWQELIKPTNLEVTSGEGGNKAKIVVEPLERGFGLTLGNALRRVLLSSLQGGAVTAIKIDGVLLEFSVIPGVREDVTDIVLNVKGLAVAVHNEGQKIMTLNAKGPCTVTAAMIETGHDVEIMNPDHVICNLDAGANISMELTVDTGKGYVPASQNKPADAPIGLIAVDSIFSPVKKVSYKVENTRVGQITDYDKLTMVVETNAWLLRKTQLLLRLVFCKTNSNRSLTLMNRKMKLKMLRKNCRLTAICLRKLKSLNFQFVLLTALKMITSFISVTLFRKLKPKCFALRTLVVSL